MADPTDPTDTPAAARARKFTTAAIVVIGVAGAVLAALMIASTMALSDTSRARGEALAALTRDVTTLRGQLSAEGIKPKVPAPDVRLEQAKDGADGSVGPTGPRGERGPKGDNGLSITGSPGPTGKTGDQGLTGFPGASVTGPPGRAGIDGAPGGAGPVGPVGATGATGPAGVNGKDGAPGEPGEPGPAGPAGANGSAPAGIVIPDGKGGYCTAVPDPQLVYACPPPPEVLP